MAKSAGIYQVPHHTLPGLLLAAAWIVLPLLWRGPLSLLMVALLLLAWRWQVARGRWVMPSALMRFVLLAALSLLVLWHYRTLLGPEAGSHFLALLLMLKMLEMFHRRDAYVVILLGYFVLAMVFLFHRGPLMSGYVALGFVLWGAALIGIHQGASVGRYRQHLRLSAVMFLQALPLLLISFVLVPRVAPLWGFSWQTSHAQTGLSDQMSVGSITKLSQSSEPVFRVEFDQTVPPPAQRYWRGLTYSQFDGSRWQQGSGGIGNHPLAAVHYRGQPLPTWLASLEQQKRQSTADYRYRILLEPSGERWLYALDVPFSQQPKVGLTQDFRLLKKKPVNQLFSYRVASYSDMRTDLVLPDDIRQQELALPQGINPKTHQMAQQWRTQSGSDEAYINRVLQWFHQQPFYYTLQPDRLTGRDSIDDFLFSSRRGFCAHYASAFAVLMRSAGIPARIVAGYQGGSINTLGDYLQVRQYDAHAWVEVWLNGRGWVREDPTAAVAPSRIEEGVLATLRSQGESRSVSRLEGLGQLAIFNRLAPMTGYVSFLWQRWVVGYDQKSQHTLLANWWGQGRWFYPLLIAVLISGSVFMIIGWWLRQQRQSRLLPWQRAYWQLYYRLQRRGLPLNPWLTPKQLAEQASERWPDKAAAFERWLGCYTQLAYRPVDQISRREIRHLKRLQRHL